MLCNCFGIRRQFTIYQMITRHSNNINNYTLECTPASPHHFCKPPTSNLATHQLPPTFHRPPGPTTTHSYPHRIRMYQHFLASASLHIQLAVYVHWKNWCIRYIWICYCFRFLKCIYKIYGFCNTAHNVRDSIFFTSWRIYKIFFKYIFEMHQCTHAYTYFIVFSQCG